MVKAQASETELTVGPQVLASYSRLSYTMWHALAEFIDNSTQSRWNYGGIIDDVLKQEGTPLVVDIVYDKINKMLIIKDNSIGMSKSDLIQALKIANPTPDSLGRSKYGLGMKTAACWIGRHWRVITCEWDSGEEWIADVDVEGVAFRGERVPLRTRKVDKSLHYTKIVIEDLYRSIHKRSEENIRAYLGSMYRFDILEGSLKIVFNGEEISSPDDAAFDTDPSGQPMRLEIPEWDFGGKKVTGWVGVLRPGAGGRKYGGFSIFQNRRQIQGFPNAWKPRSLFGGTDEEGANNLIAQRLTGVLNLDGFEVSHTKDAILFQGDEEEELEEKLYELTTGYRAYAAKRRNPKTQLWSREKVRDLVRNISQEFSNPEMGDTLTHAVLPPLDNILASNRKQVENLNPDDYVGSIPIDDIKVIVSLQERSEYDPHVVIVAGASPNCIHVIINGLHPYYSSIETVDAVDECIRQYIYDALSEYRVNQTRASLTPDSVRRMKDALLRVKEVSIQNAAEQLQRKDYETLVSGLTPRR